MQALSYRSSPAACPTYPGNFLWSNCDPTAWKRSDFGHRNILWQASHISSRVAKQWGRAALLVTFQL